MRALVIGLAATGVAVADALRADGIGVTVAEDAPGEAAGYAERVAAVRAAGAELVETPGATRAGDLARHADIVVPSPLVRPDHPAIVAARAAGVPVRSEIDIAGERARVPIVAVTGTNGKTTVTSMSEAMLRASGRRALAAGNIGRPLIAAVTDDVDVIVAEVSSFQLEFVTSFRPRVAVLLAITPDHLDWHGSFDDYVAAKARVAAQQRDDDLLVFDADDATARAVAAAAPARSVGVSARSDANACYRVADGSLVAPDGHELARVAEMRRALAHDCTNALTAAAAALEVGGTVAGVRAALREYTTMPHRVALVGEAMGVKWYDDSKATNPDATVRAVSSFESVVLLVGGRNKGLDLSVLASLAPRLRAVVAFGESGPEIASAFAHAPTSVAVVATMHDAVQAAAAAAEPGDVVLLSPACASFDAYRGYAARGDDFAAEVAVLARQEHASR